MKILLATGIYPPDIGGPATYSKLLFDRLPEKGIDVHVVSFGSVRHLPKIIRHLVFFIKLVIHSWGVKVIYAQDTVSVGLPASLAAFVLRKPFMVRVPGDYAWEQAVQRFDVKDTIDDFQHKRYGFKTELLRRVQKFVVGRAVRVITPSHYFRVLVGGWICHPERVMTIYNGIDMTSLPSVSTYEPKTILSAGRLVPWKGFKMLILALRDLPDWKLYIAGDGPDYATLKLFIEEQCLSARAILLGKVERSVLLDKIQHCEIFALNTHFESFSFLAVEAMYCGTPVITTRIGNLTEIVDDGISGLLITPDDTQDFLRYITLLHTDQKMREKIVNAAKKKAEMFSIESTLQKTAEVIVGLAHSPSHEK